MKRLLIVPLALLALSTSALAEDAAKPASPPEVTRAGPGQITGSRTASVKAKVTAVDQEKRTITVEGKDGQPETFAVSPDVKRLKDIAAGDTISVKYKQTLTLQHLGQGAEKAEPSVMVGAERNTAEKAPGGAAAAQLKGVVTVKSCDSKTRTVGLETEKGYAFKLKADKSIDMKNCKAGLKFNGIYGEELAIQVEKAKPAAAKPAAEKPAAK